MICCGTRKKEFIFENGTKVLAIDYQSAIVKLHSIDTKNFTIENIREYTWRCTFSSCVFVEFESPSIFRAQLQGPYLIYLDKRLT